MRDFTLTTYTRLLERLRELDFQTRRFDELDDTGPLRMAVLRHDVDRLPFRALAMARLEAQCGARATYFFRTKRVSFDRDVIHAVQDLGHEIGYHYECLSDARGDAEAAWRLFCRDLERFDPFGGVRTIAMHGRPLSPHDNRDLWTTHDYRHRGVEREAYLDLPAGEFEYFTDVGGRWDDFHNRRDYLDGGRGEPRAARTTPELLATLEGIGRNVVISTHPERWPSGSAGWVQARTTDLLMNAAKRVLAR